MHTDPYDSAGTNLLEVAKYLGILENVRFSDQEASFEKLNILYNISDIVLNISQAEGFGLNTPQGYKAKIMDKGAQKSVEATVRKLKTEQANTGGSSSLGVKDKEPSNARTTGRKKLQRANNIFKRI